ncbi:unnamed protein product [Paramecium sonneborni]|uniref:Uncharacterized protein n=1 Tax=Paramecium sonneborni TaxID=65129 RepID=A0A8S1MDX9_9CILI|nr:unnamed protein product [Paramecium sonneborni]
MNEQSKDIITQFLNKDPIKRLGHKSIQEIKQHNFFKEINWEDLSNFRVQSPILEGVQKLQLQIAKEVPIAKKILETPQVNQNTQNFEKNDIKKIKKQFDQIFVHLINRKISKITLEIFFVISQQQFNKLIHPHKFFQVGLIDIESEMQQLAKNFQNQLKHLTKNRKQHLIIKFINNQVFNSLKISLCKLFFFSFEGQ